MLEALYSWLWTYWGVVTLGIGGGIVCIVIGRYVLEEVYAFSGLFYLGCIAVLCTLIYSILWAIWGPFSIHWILVPIILLSLIHIVKAANDGFDYSYWDINEEVIAGSLFVLVVVVGAYVVALADGVRAKVVPDAVAARWAAQDTVAVKGGEKEERQQDRPQQRIPRAQAGQQVKREGWITVNGDSAKPVNEAGGSVPRVVVHDFWPQEVSVAPGGYLTTGDGVALRVLASSYVVPLFDTAKTEFPRGVMDVMKPFSPYYVLRQEGAALLLAAIPDAPLSQAYWARRSDCYAWATGTTIEVNREVVVYANAELARAGKRPLNPTAKYINPAGIHRSSGDGGPEPLDRLPVLSRSGNLAAFLSPVRGGTLCWINLDRHGNAVTWRNELNP